MRARTFRRRRCRGAQTSTPQWRMRVEAARQRCGYSVLAHKSGNRIVGLEGHPRRRHCRRATYELPLLLRLRAGRRRARAASDGRGPGSRGARSRVLEQPVGLVGMPGLRPGPGLPPPI